MSAQTKAAAPPVEERNYDGEGTLDGMGTETVTVGDSEARPASEPMAKKKTGLRDDRQSKRRTSI